MLSLSRIGVCLLVLGALAAAQTARAEQVTLQPTRDVTLYDPEPEKANGSGSYVFAGRTNGGKLRRAIFHFDVAGSIPAGSTVSAATLTSNMSRTIAGTSTVTLHRVTATWGEGASNADNQEGDPTSAQANDATWVYRFYDPSNPSSSPAWATQGGDFVSAASGSQSIGDVGSYVWNSTPGMVSDVQGWLDSPALNYGWLLRGGEAADRTAKRFDSSENAVTANRPRLTITFTPPVVAGACCAAIGSCTVPGGLAECTAQGGSYQGNGSTCTPNPCPQPTGACCLPTPTATCTTQTAAACSAQTGVYQGDFSACAATECPVVLTPFLDALPIPAVATPTSGVVGGAATYTLAMREVAQSLHSQLPPTRVWGFGAGPSGASYPGPTIEAGAGQPVTVVWQNDLRDPNGSLRTSHALPVDTCLHGAMDASPRTVVHLHGGHVPAAVDGYPENTFLPGQQDTYVYPNNQIAGPLWYHDHALGITRLNVTMGLAGFYLLRDAVESALGLPSGSNEIALAVQDRSFRPDGSLEYPAEWMEHFFGDSILVNGKVWPYLNVRQGKYRLRILNGSTSRTYRLALGNGASFQQIGAEGGLLPAPVTLTQVTIGSGERADVVMDFAPYPAGTQITLVNDAPAPFPGVPGVGVVPNVMRFVVQNEAGHTAPLPATLRPLEVLQEADATIAREFTLQKMNDACTGSRWAINGLEWDDITEYPELGETEIWSFVNRSGMTHPMHLHLVMFQVLDRQDFQLVGGAVVPIGPRVPPPPQEAGWKDTVQVGPSEILRVIARFEDYTGRFPYHCHILEHEDHEMMRQFQTVQCGNGAREPGEECDDGNAAGADGCSANCGEEQVLYVEGNAQGGSVSVTVEGVLVNVTTVSGQTAAQVAAAIAAAINANAALQASGVSAATYGASVATDGALGPRSSGDPGITLSPPALIPALHPLAGILLAACVLLGGAGILRARLART